MRLQFLRVPVLRQLLSGLHPGPTTSPLIRVGEAGMVEARRAAVMNEALVPEQLLLLPVPLEPWLPQASWPRTPAQWHPELRLWKTGYIQGGVGRATVHSATRLLQLTHNTCQLKQTFNSPVLTNGPGLQSKHLVMFCSKNHCGVQESGWDLLGKSMNLGHWGDTGGRLKVQGVWGGCGIFPTFVILTTTSFIHRLECAPQGNSLVWKESQSRNPEKD